MSFLDGYDFIRYISERFTTFIHEQQRGKEQEEEKKKQSRNYSNALFGLLPFAMKYIYQNRKRKK